MIDFDEVSKIIRNDAALGKELVGTGDSPFLTLEETVSKNSVSKDCLLRFASEGKINLFFQFSIEKIETGKLNLSPTPRNPVEWPADIITHYAQPLFPEAEMHLQINPKYFEPSSYEYPDAIPILLHPRHARAILNGQELFLKYGWLPNGTAFHVVEPPGGVRVTSAGILIARHSINELVRNEERAKKAQEIQKMGKWYCPCPVEWLKKKEWSVLTAMMLFAGLNPKWSDLTWDTHGKCAEAKHIERIGWEYSYKDAGYALLSKEQLEKDLISIRKEAEENLNQRRQEIRAFGINVHSAQILAQYRTPK